MAALDLAQVGTLTFEAVDAERFPSVNLARHALRCGGSAATILNAANEVAVAAFLAEKLRFLAVTELVGRTLARAERDGAVAPLSSLDDVWAADRYGRAVAQELARQLLD